MAFVLGRRIERRGGPSLHLQKVCLRGLPLSQPEAERLALASLVFIFRHGLYGTVEAEVPRPPQLARASQAFASTC